jgi:hypothetical protein
MDVLTQKRHGGFPLCRMKSDFCRSVTPKKKIGDDSYNVELSEVCF